MTWRVKPHVTAPSGVSGLSVTPDPYHGWNLLSWTNPPDVNVKSVVVERRPSLGANGFHLVDNFLIGKWVQIAPATSIPGNVPAFLRDYAPLNQTYDYRVSTRTREGMGSATTEVDGVVLIGKFGKYPFWATSLIDYDSVGFGAIDPGDFGTSTGYQIQNQLAEVISPGRSLPLMDVNPVAYPKMTGVRFTVPAFYSDGVNTPVYGIDVIREMEEVSRQGPGTRVWLRDFMANAWVAVISNFQPQSLDGLNFSMTFDFTVVDSPLQYLALTSDVTSDTY